MLNCSVIGATSFTGNELIRILARHPRARIAALTTRSEEKIYARDLVPALGKTSELVVEQYDFKKVVRVSDVVFLTLPHTEAAKIASDFYDQGKVVIDLSADFRLRQEALYKKWYGEVHPRKNLLRTAVYGLPELYRAKIRTGNLIANPGCYPTGAILGLAPLLKARLISADRIVIDSKSGVSGAGRKLSQGTQFCEVNENFGAYKVNRHQHTPEIEQALSDVAGESIGITFVPHLLPVTRGILSTIYVQKKKNVTKEKIAKAFQTFADSEPFVKFLGLNRFPTLKDVQGTNFCHIGVTADSDWVIVITAIDNLIKGASGQAVQNMNIRFGFPEEAGLIG